MMEFNAAMEVEAQALRLRGISGACLAVGEALLHGESEGASFGEALFFLAEQIRQVEEGLLKLSQQA